MCSMEQKSFLLRFCFEFTLRGFHALIYIFASFSCLFETWTTINYSSADKLIGILKSSTTLDLTNFPFEMCEGMKILHRRLFLQVAALLIAVLRKGAPLINHDDTSDKNITNLYI